MACYQCCIVDDTLMSIYLTATCGNRALLYLLTLPSLKDKGNIFLSDALNRKFNFKSINSMKASLFSYVISAALSFATIATASKPVENDTISSKKAEISERNVMLNASDANKPREIQIGLPSEDVNVYENGLPAVYSSAVHKLATHWRSDASLGEVGLMTPSESAIATGNIAYSVNSFSKLGQRSSKESWITAPTILGGKI